MRTEGKTAVALDAHRPVQNSSQPLCFFWAGDIAATHAHLSALGTVVDVGSAQTLAFRGQNGALPSLCQGHEL